MTPARTPLLRSLAAAGVSLALSACHPAPSTSQLGDAAARREEAIRIVEQARKLQDRGKLDEACALYRQAATLAPDLPIAWNNLGVALMEQSHFLDSAQAFKIAADLLPTDPRPYQNLGLVYQRAGFDDEALTYYEKALERDPNWLPALRGTAVCTRRMGYADQRVSDRLHHALLVETDVEWREIIQRERLRIDGQLKEAERARERN